MIAWRMLEEQIQVLPPELVHKKNESELYVVIGNNSRIDIKGADNPDSLRGVGLSGVVLDEYADIKPHVYDEIIAPALIDKKGFAIFIGTPKGFNHFYDLYNGADALDGWASFSFTSYDNPHLDKEELEKEKQRITEDRFAQEYLADFRKQEGLVYKEFDRQRHTYDTEVENVKEKLVGVDFGYTNPAAVLTILVDSDGTYYVDYEWYKTGQTEEQIAEYVASIDANACYPDPENPSAIKVLKDKRVNVREVVKGKDSVSSGIQKVRELFKQGKIRVHKRCLNLLFELENYAYEPKQDKNQPEVPIKLNDHALDSLRYIITMNKQNAISPAQMQRLYQMRKRALINHAK